MVVLTVNLAPVFSPFNAEIAGPQFGLKLRRRPSSNLVPRSPTANFSVENRVRSGYEISPPLDPPLCLT